ncbi:hypothetical protein D3C81_1844130 [compost metagenome]
MQTDGENIKREGSRRNTAYQAEEQGEQNFIGRPLLRIHLDGERNRFQHSGADSGFMHILDVQQMVREGG